jgi:ubiquinone/menaquinone biosynthesis C-methylase UbiE
MFDSNTDREWEKWGKNDPYFGVITYDKYNISNLTNDNKKEFFRSGYDYIDHVIKFIKKHIYPTYTVNKALDFGCGVGRLVIPLTEIADHVTGVDVSESMLNEAKKNCETISIHNVTFLKSDDNLSLLNGNYDLIISSMVFQHIPVKRGENIFKNLLAHLEIGGVCVVHFTYANPYKLKIRKIVRLIKNYIPFGKNIINVIKGRNFFAPVMQMNAYDINKLFFVMQKSNVYGFHAEYSDHGGWQGIVLYFTKSG